MLTEVVNKILEAMGIVSSTIYEANDSAASEFVYHLKWDKAKDLRAQLDIEFLEQDGGGEGGAEDCSITFRLDGKCYEGYYSYASYDGWDFYGFWDSLVEVVPEQVVVTQYKRVK